MFFAGMAKANYLNQDDSYNAYGLTSFMNSNAVSLESSAACLELNSDSELRAAF